LDPAEWFLVTDLADLDVPDDADSVISRLQIYLRRWTAKGTNAAVVGLPAAQELLGQADRERS